MKKITLAVAVMCALSAYVSYPSAEERRQSAMETLSPMAMAQNFAFAADRSLRRDLIATHNLSKQRAVIPEDHARCVVSGGAGDAAAGMGAAAAVIEAL